MTQVLKKTFSLILLIIDKNVGGGGGGASGTQFNQGF